ncbi:MAG: 2-oxo acid dehydrogenase subunit E2 [Spirochaetales bacterium]|nr:2-oxo acid dehydrogenase subunit E2 [Spirochaetales bacterium]
MDKKFSLAKKIIAYSTVNSWKRVPHVTFLYEPDITELYTLYLSEKEKLLRSCKISLSFNTFVLKFIVEGIKAAPVLNTTLKYSDFFMEGSIRQTGKINLGIPWLLETGEALPVVVRDAGNKSFEELAVTIEGIKLKLKNTNIEELLFRILIKDTLRKLSCMDFTWLKRLVSILLGKNRLHRAGKEERQKYYSIPETDRLNPEDIMTPAIIVSNIGSVAGKINGALTLLEIIPPHIVAFGIGSVQERPCVVKDENNGNIIAARKILPLCIAFDHRAIGFNDIVPFLEKLDRLCSGADEMGK